MDTFSSSSKGSKAHLQRVQLSTRSGKKYLRSPGVDDEIYRVLRLNQSEWFQEAPTLRNETLVRKPSQSRMYSWTGHGPTSTIRGFSKPSSCIITKTGP